MAAFAVFRLPEVFNQAIAVHHPKQPLSSWRSESTAIRCCMRSPAQKQRMGQNYYELLGISVDSNPREIKNPIENYKRNTTQISQANRFRSLPVIIISGEMNGSGRLVSGSKWVRNKGHEHTLLLNEAYNVLMKDDLRKDYDASIGQVRVRFGEDALNMGYSSWNGPFRPQALFVDENACIGCRECVHNARKTFVMDETLGCARVNVQFGDDDTNIEVAVESCPMDCIHWVEKEDLAVLEYLNTPRAKQGHGVFGQGWERPANVFMAAKTFQKQQKQQQAESQRRSVRRDVEKETAAQAQARESASLKLKMEKFTGFWEWMKKITPQ